MIAVAFASIILFLYNIIAITNNKQAVENRNKINSLITSIEQKQNSVDADLLYDNKEGANKTINEIEEMLKQLPNGTMEEQKQRTVFLEKLNSQLEKIRLSVNINEFKEIADLAKIDNRAKPGAITINSDSILFINDSFINKIYLVKTKENLITSKDYDGEEGQIIDFPINGLEDKNIFFISKEKAYRINGVTNEIAEIPFSSPIDFENIAAASGYNGKFYIANKQSSQIQIFSQSGGKLLFAQNWLKDSTDIKNTASMAIDGSLYLLKNNGDVTKLSKGKKIEFNQEAISPPLTSADKIITSADQQYIYISDFREKRIVVFDKNGKLSIQYRLVSLEPLSDFTVNEKDKKIYILSGAKILSFDAKKIQ
jgi:WD40 repeat protein